MKSTKRARRRAKRRAKGLRRLLEDRAQHAADRSSCPCLGEESRSGGKIFARFADTPKLCSSPSCCGNPRRRGELTIQERRVRADDDDRCSGDALAPAATC
jgi:hypothetical protein